MDNRPDRETLRRLLAVRQRPSVSLYLPTHRAGREIAQDPIRLKNLLRQAETQITKSNGLARGVLQPARELLEDAVFWRHQSDGLALFSTEGSFDYYRLPVTFPEVAHVGDRFYLKPLFAYLNQDTRFYVLALSQNRVRLLEGSENGLQEMACPDLPESLAAAVPTDEPGSEVQFRSLRTGSEGSYAIYHGHAGGEGSAEDLLQFFRACDTAVTAALREEQAPLILACVADHVPLYRQTNTYGNLENNAIQGSPDTWSEKELFEKAWPIIERRISGHVKSTMDLFSTARARGRASADLVEVLRAAPEGRIEALFLPEGEQLLGAWDSATGTLELDPGAADAQDLLDLVATETYLNRGEVLAVEKSQMPDQSPLAAVFRY